MNENERRKELKQQYSNRHPDMGIVSWRCGDKIWATKSNDIKADFNRSIFQLKLGSWVNREMQKAYNENPEGFIWTIEEQLDYEELSDELNEDLDIMYIEFTEAHPEAKPMKPIKKIR